MKPSSTAFLLDRPPVAAEDPIAEYLGDHDGLLLPGGPRLYVLHGDASMARLTIRRRIFAPLPTAGLIGPTTAIADLRRGGATLMGVRLRATAWGALFGGDLSRLTDKVVPLTTIDRATWQSDERHGDHAAAVFGPWLAARTNDRSLDDTLAARVIALLDATPRMTVAEIAAALRVTPQQLTAFCLEKFGLPPRRLLSLRRFVRVVRRLLADPSNAGRTLWQAGYVDRSHFGKDCRKILGSSFQAFRERSGSHAGGHPRGASCTPVDRA